MLKTFWKVIVEPKETVMELIKQEKFKTSVFISFLVGVTYWLGVEVSANQGANPDINLYDIVAGAFLVGGSIGLVFLYFFAFVIKFTTRKFRKNEIDFKHLVLAISWGSSPMLLILIMVIIEIILLGKGFFIVKQDYASMPKNISYIIQGLETLKFPVTIITFITLYRTATSFMAPEPKANITVSRVKTKRKKKKK